LLANAEKLLSSAATWEAIPFLSSAWSVAPYRGIPVVKFFSLASANTS